MPPAVCWPLKTVHPIMCKSDRGITQLSSKFNKLVPILNAYGRGRGITQPIIQKICSKVNPVIYTLVENLMSTKRILAYAVLPIFVNKLVPIQKAYIRKRGITQENIYDKCSKVNLIQFIYLYANYKDLSLCGSSDILLTSLFLYKMPMSEKGE